MMAERNGRVATARTGFEILKRHCFAEDKLVTDVSLMEFITSASRAGSLRPCRDLPLRKLFILVAGYNTGL
jgi:hypothetical protein